MDVIVRGHRVSVPERFRQLATAKLAKLAKLDQKAMRIDVEISKERNSRQSDRRERVELTIRSRGPAIRAEAAAADRYTAFDLAYAKLESRLRRACDRRKVRPGEATVRSPHVLADVTTGAATGTAAVNGHPDIEQPVMADLPGEWESDWRPSAQDTLGRDAASRDAVGWDAAGWDAASRDAASRDAAGWDAAGWDAASRDRGEGNVVPIQMEGDGPLVVREKIHTAKPMTIDQALFEMELVGHDFFLFHDADCDRFSVVYRRRGYDYGVIRLVEE